MKFYLTGAQYEISLQECQDKRSLMRRGTCIIRENDKGSYDFYRLSTSPIYSNQSSLSLTINEYNEALAWLAR